jgi:hypothetical protein
MKLGRVLPDRMWGSALGPPEAGATLRFGGVLMASRAKVAIVGGSISAWRASRLMATNLPFFGCG